MSKTKRFTNEDILRLQTKGLIVEDCIIDTKLKKAFGLPVKKQYSGKEKDHIEWVLIGLKLDFKKEFKFHETRKFRFDWAIPNKLIAIEYEGIYGSNSNGQTGHTGLKSYSRDVIKYNLALINGWKVLRYTANNFMSIGIDLEKLLMLCK